jgi:AraC-like DNA-binding protein
VFLEIGIWLIYFGLIVIWFVDKSFLGNPSAFINSIITIFILSISIFGIRYSTVFSLSVAHSLPAEIPFEPEVSENKDFSEKKPLKIKPNLKTEFEQLTSYFEQKQPFLNENLSLQDVSIELNMHQRILSEIIGSQTGKNFFDFVNSYRVEYFNRQIVLPKNKNLTILAVAFECGFGSKSAFSRAYKKHSGITPSEFIKKNRNSKI